ncbi:hypothetical protein [Nocardioides houyundeii]|uniref:hypothetical protein n=1 Tax=Nocardioides houyundeii TaxID=2045452 RepID=UPI0013B3BD62|nr:hypothetical protein [Nocardioides houyundeii]
MKRARHVTSAVALATVVPVLALGGALAPADAAAATTCLDKPVTIVASQEVTSGTEGDDVVAMTPGDWNTFDALGGDDTICLAVPDSFSGSETGEIVGFVTAGSGDDVVVNESSSNSSHLSVLLGSGDDTFTGSSSTRVVEHVYADSVAIGSNGLDKPPAGSQRDVIHMGGGADGPPEDQHPWTDWPFTDTVWSVAPRGGLNNDDITFGPGGALLHQRGAMAPEARLDFSAADWAGVHLPNPGAAEPVARGELLLDNATRRATVDGRQVMTWEGHVDAFQLGSQGSRDWPFPASFIGSDDDELLTFPNGTFGDVRMGGGDDRLGRSYSFASRVNTLPARSVDGGPGNDAVSLHNRCTSLTIRLTKRMTCDGDSLALPGFEGVQVLSRGVRQRLLIVGSRGDDFAEVLYAPRVTFRGRGGADEAVINGNTVRAAGGPGADRLTIKAEDVVARGGPGADRIHLVRPAYFHPPQRLVALGGPGPDVLRGPRHAYAARLVGGPGRDRADGGGGGRDHCDAEVTRRCKLG